jgi:hypothetical protein
MKSSMTRTKGMVGVIFTSSGWKVWVTSSVSHWPVAGSISSLTHCRRCLPRWEHGLLVVPLGIHGSFHMWTDRPSLIRHMIPFFNSSIPFRTLLHVYDISSTSIACSTFPFGKYFALRTCAQSELVFWMSHTLVLIAWPYWRHVDHWTSSLPIAWAV